MVSAKHNEETRDSGDFERLIPETKAARFLAYRIRAPPWELRARK